MPPPCVLFEDDHLLVVNKPAGLNTHAPAPFAGEGLYEWLHHREPRWADLAIIHRLDKETSGVMVFGKTTAANRSLTAQFAGHSIRKKYLLIADRPVRPGPFTVVSSLIRTGEKYASRPLRGESDRAETRFRLLKQEGDRWLVEAEPVTGRTHQIRVHAAAGGFPILGDTLYGGSDAPRVCLHAVELRLHHPVSGGELTFSAPADFDADSRLALRAALLDARETDAFRILHGAADGWPGWYVDKLGDFLLSQGAAALDADKRDTLERLYALLGARGVYHKNLTAHVSSTNTAEASPRHLLEETAAGPLIARENGVPYELSFNEGYSVGLFLDQRENRRRLLTNHVAANFPLFPSGAPGTEVLNLFAYTCGFSVCAALAGARVTSVDLSKKYLAWGARNMRLNGLDPARHDFIYGDAFDWLRRLAAKGRAFDAVILDPPTFSKSRQRGAFQAVKDFERLAGAALPLLKPGGVLFASTNAARFDPQNFLDALDSAVKKAGRQVEKRHYVPQPPDFPVHRTEPAYLKTVWLRVD